MNWTKNILLVSVSFIVSLLLAEGLLRFMKIGYGNAPLERSKIYHHAHPKNYSFLAHDPNGEYGGHHVFYDETGYRVSEIEHNTFSGKQNSKAIVFMGDSFTEANQVSYEDAFVSRIGISLDSPNLNFGVSSYSPLIYLLQAKNEISKLKSDLVLLQIFSNDFKDDIKYRKDAIYSDGKIIGIDGGENSLFISMLRQSYLARFVRKSQLLIMTLASSEKSLQESGTNSYEEAFLHEQNITADEFVYTVQIIKKIQEELSLHNKRLAVFMIPSKSLSMINQCCDRDDLYHSFQKEMKKMRIIFLDAAKYFSAHPKQNTLFFGKDIHLTKEGHKVLANALIKELNFYSLL